MVSGGWIAARIRIGPRHRGHSSTSIAKTRFISSAHASRLALAASGRGGAPALTTGMADGLATSSLSGVDPADVPAALVHGCGADVFAGSGP